MGFRFGHFLVVTIVQGLLIEILSRTIPGVRAENVWTAILGTALIVAATGMMWPFVYVISSRFKPLFFPLIVFLLTGVSILLASSLFTWLKFDGLQIDGLWTGIVVALTLAAANTLIAAFFADDDRTYDRYITLPIMRAHKAPVPGAQPGFVFFEVDGLAEPILREAIAGGHMPNIARWLKNSDYAITPWEPDLSSQTAASQAGILLGNNDNIPAFRWYDREAGEVLVSSSLKTAAMVEDRLSKGTGLLVSGGASRSNMFSGDAEDSLLTFATIGRRRSGEDVASASSRSYFLFFANPFTVVRLIIFLIYDICLEWFQAIRQTVMRVRPRINRWGIYPLVRAFTTAASPEINTYMVISDIARGVPSLYATYYAYDEVAHHSGIRSPDVWGVLRRLDRHIGRIERAIHDAPRPYHLVILSDHGQSNGATFRQRYGETLREFVSRMLPPGNQVATAEHRSEALGHLEAAASEAENQGAKAAKMARRAVRATARTFESEQVDTVSDDVEPNFQVLASGNLAVIYDTSSPERLTFEELTLKFPLLLPGLINHEGVGFVRVHSVERGEIVLGRYGAHMLETGEIVDDDPIIQYGPNVARHLLRHARFANTPDILVISRYWPDDDEVAAFEELVGSHGGVGGAQTQPFVLHPVELQVPPTPIVGTAELHAVFKGWIGSSIPANSDEMT